MGAKLCAFFDSNDGALIKDIYISPNQTGGSFMCDAVFLDDSSFVVLSDNRIHHKDWAWGPTVAEVLLTNVVRGISPNEILLVGRKGTNFFLTKLSYSGEVLMSDTAASPSSACVDHVVLRTGVIVCLDPNSGTISTARFDNRPFITRHIKDIVPKSAHLSPPFRIISSHFDDIVLIGDSNGEVLVVNFKHAPDLDNIHIFSNEKNLVFSQAERENERYLVGVAMREKETRVYILSLDSRNAHDVEKYENVKGDEEGTVSKVWLNTFVKKDGTTAFRVLLSTSSHSLFLLKEKNIIFSREESLASVIDAAFLDLPPKTRSFSEENRERERNAQAHTHTHLSSSSNSLSLFSLLSKIVSRWSSHTSEALAFISQRSSSPQSSSSDSSEDVITGGDRFGFNKIIVILTSPGKVFGVLTENGKVAWRKYISLPSSPSLHSLHVTRTSLYHHLECVVLGTTSRAARAPSFMLWINPLSGSETGMQSLSYSVKYIHSLPLIDAEHRQLLLCVDEKMMLHLFPDTENAHRIFASSVYSTFFYLVYDEEKMIKGYSISSASSSDGFETRFQYTANEIWSIVFSKEETVAAIAPRTPETIKSAGRVLGDRSVLFKYLNPNLIALITTSSLSLSLSDSTSSEAHPPHEIPTLRVYLIDAVTGHVLHSCIHEHAHSPVNLIQSENMVIYTYFNTQQHRTELSSIELFEEASPGWVGKSIQNYLFKNGTRPKFSSRTASPPLVFAKTFIVPVGVKSLHVSTTALGITSKQILLGLISDQIYALDRALVDVRRPVEAPTQEDKEEGLLPYSPFLPLIQTSFLSTNRTIFGLQKIKTAAARAESTSLVFSWGIDLFFTRTTPSKTFDRLQDEFNKTSLLLALIALTAITAAVYFWNRRQDIQTAWK